ncbi:hypothetical protein E4U17_006260 [Claviceps sp. LM77 group G4]|nr:hypothetical protein E4U17_006260 [Claviceps sp. LM77 group G4]
MNDVISCGVAAIYILRQSICSTSSGLSPIKIQQHSRKPHALGRALSDEVVGEQTFSPDAVCADCLGEVEIRHCRHHGRGPWEWTHVEASKGSEFDMLVRPARG